MQQESESKDRKEADLKRDKIYHVLYSSITACTVGVSCIVFRKDGWTLDGNPLDFSAKLGFPCMIAATSYHGVHFFGTHILPIILDEFDSMIRAFVKRMQSIGEYIVLEPRKWESIKLLWSDEGVVAVSATPLCAESSPLLVNIPLDRFEAEGARAIVAALTQ